MTATTGKPLLSMVVAMFNMRREARRTLFSLTAEYQQGVTEQEYEVIVVDDGSSMPLTADYLASLSPIFRYYYFDNSSLSPAQAINFGVTQATGSFVGLMVDGARILSPGVLRYALCSFRAFRKPVVSTLAWHLGPDVQQRSILQGYNQADEDRLLASIQWPKDGYRLFEIASLAGSSARGWFLPIAECNCFFMSRQTFNALDGYDEKFNQPAGGLVNLDMYKRACELPGSDLVTLLGEGSFHQIHGGTTTNITEEQNRLHWEASDDEYRRIRGSRFSLPTKRPLFLGHAPTQALRWLAHSVEAARAKPAP